MAFPRPFHPELFDGVFVGDAPIKAHAVLQGNPDFLIAQILDANGVLQRSMTRAGDPLPGETKMRSLRFVNEHDVVRFCVTGAGC